MRELELLAPAKNLACGIAAIDHGADAVYIGAPRFGARAAAGNSVEDIRQLCDYAHLFGAKVYVTVNTILYDEELDDTARMVQELWKNGVDAILVQDMGLLEMPLPPIALHASTQTDNRTADKVRWLAGLGFRRVVLARELSVEEIATIHRAVPNVELEVFVHGALCVSYSGLCYASQHCFGRSANRGACAQFCRMKFDLLDADGRELEHQRHLLSLKDLNQLNNLDRLVEAGASSFKIEGRLKDVAYVKNVVAAYNIRLNVIVESQPEHYRRASRGACRYTFIPNLKKTFNRGFTSYFLNGRQPDIFSPDTPKAMGEYVGSVKEIRGHSFNVAGTASFANGDGLCFINADRELEGFRVNRAEGNRLFPQRMPQHLRPGMALYRNSDQDFEKLLAKPSSVRTIPLVMHLSADDKGFCLTADGVTARMDCAHQTAEKPQHENIIRQLSKLGGTPYECREVEMDKDFPWFIPASMLAELRRRLVDLLQQAARTATKTGVTAEGTVEHAGEKTSLPSSVAALYPVDYLYNVANGKASDFYVGQGLQRPGMAYEKQTGKVVSPLLMQCRHCLRYALGACLKHGGRKPEWREPLFLRLADGRRFRLEFDCRHCQMNVYGEDEK